MCTANKTTANFFLFSLFFFAWKAVVIMSWAYVFALRVPAHGAARVHEGKMKTWVTQLITPANELSFKSGTQTCDAFIFRGCV